MRIKLRKWTSKSSTKNLDAEEERNYQASCIEAGLILRERREALGITRNDLALRTRISPRVLEAFEQGWKEQLPEEAYLSSMLSLLENQLNLASGSLKGALKENRSNAKKGFFSSFPIWKIEIFRHWQGSILYLLIMLISLLALNRHQEKLAVINSKTMEPISSNFLSKNISISKENNKAKTISSNLNNKKNLSISNWFSLLLINKYFSKGNQSELEIRLSNPRQLNIKSPHNYGTRIKSIEGIIKLRLRPPVFIEITPAPSPKDLIIWNGKKYSPGLNDTGIYKLVVGASEPSSNLIERSQKAPLSP